MFAYFCDSILAISQIIAANFINGIERITLAFYSDVFLLRGMIIFNHGLECRKISFHFSLTDFFT